VTQAVPYPIKDLVEDAVDFGKLMTALADPALDAILRVAGARDPAGGRAEPAALVRSAGRLYVIARISRNGQAGRRATSNRFAVYAEDGRPAWPHAPFCGLGDLAAVLADRIGTDATVEAANDRQDVARRLAVLIIRWRGTAGR
jgi:hypothetical protein